MNNDQPTSTLAKPVEQTQAATREPVPMLPDSNERIREMLGWKLVEAARKVC